VAGSRELEQIFFSLRHCLLEVSLGEYVWDELLIYISEMCKEIDSLEINNTQIGDAAISHILKRLTYLRVLDLSACANFTGMALAESVGNFVATNLR